MLFAPNNSTFTTHLHFMSVQCDFGLKESLIYLNFNKT